MAFSRDVTSSREFWMLKHCNCFVVFCLGTVSMVNVKLIYLFIHVVETFETSMLVKLLWRKPLYILSFKSGFLPKKKNFCGERTVVTI